MKKIIVVYNPRSSRFKEVSREVFEKIRGEKGVLVGKYEIEPTNPRDNAERIAEVVQGGELVIAAGGDGTATIAMNGVILAREKYGKEAVFTALPFGNFNDFPRLFGELSIKEAVGKFKEGRGEEFYPIGVKINGREFWNFGVYFTVGMMAESAGVFDEKKTREKLKTGKTGIFFSARKLFFWYLKNKRKKFLGRGELRRLDNRGDVVKITTLTGKETDYVAMNGGTVARVLRAPKGSGGKDYFREEKIFWSGAEKLVGLIRLFRLGCIRGILKNRLPGEETGGDLIKFEKPLTVSLHAEGEEKRVSGVREILVRKLEKPIKVIRIERKKNERK